jgi:hypothetical protein
MLRSEPLRIVDPTDWAKLSERGLKTVLDPLVTRTASLFFEGPLLGYGDQAARQQWDIVAKNIPSLMAFFDAIILNDRIPLFAYQRTFPGDRILDFCPDFVVHIAFEQPNDKIGEAYKSIKAAALEKMRNAPTVPATLAGEIADELSAFGYEWDPGLGDLTPADQQQACATKLLLGGALFQGIANQISGKTKNLEDLAEHVVPPRRSALMAASWLQQKSVIAEREAELFADLMAAARQAHGNLLVWENHDVPSFLPALLGQEPCVREPLELLSRARSMKEKSQVKDYRCWRRRLHQGIGEGSSLIPERRELQRILDSAERELAVKRRSEVEIAAKAGVEIGTEGPKAKLGLEVSKSIDLHSLAWWLTSHFPGRGHRELLTRLVAHEGLQGEICKRLERIYFKRDC